MARAGKEHPADKWTREQIETATGFDIFFLKGPHERYREVAATLEDARTKAAALDKEHGKGGRRAIIYAVLPDGSTIPVGEPYKRAR